MNNKQVMILGGYGTFGSRIALKLAEDNINLIIVGRNPKKAQKFKSQIIQVHPGCQVELAIFDAHLQLLENLQQHKPYLLIHTCGPFQGQSVTIAKTCIEQGVHYIDLSDGREFVQNILQLDHLAQSNNTIAITAASTVPSLSSAVIQHYIDDQQFAHFSSIKYGITPGQKTDRGLATTQAVLSYIGKPIKQWQNKNKKYYGWQDTYKEYYPELGLRLMANCEIPDLDLLPQYYPIEDIQFSAGMESKALHISIWVLSWLIRLKLPIKLQNHAALLLKIGRWFDFFGTHDGGMHMHLKGYNKKGEAQKTTWYIIAKNDDGPMIPAIPAVIMAKKILNQNYKQVGVRPCIGLLSLQEYMDELAEFDVKQVF